MPHVRRTLQALGRVDRLRVTMIDSGSTDGSIEEAARNGVTLLPIPRGSYIPGRVLNLAMRSSQSEIVAFVNADAVPTDELAVLRLVDACERGAAAAYGRQIPRANARRMTRRDHQRAFPEDAKGPGFRHFFSMAASAIRRDVWSILPFDEELRYSEDVDWSFRLRAVGCEIRYVPEAVFEHSHDYDTRGMWRRMEGEGRADTAIYRRGSPRLIRQAILPLGASMARDAMGGVVGAEPAWLRTIAAAAHYWGERDAAGRPHRTNRNPKHSSAERGSRPAGALSAEAEQMVEETIRKAGQTLVQEMGQQLQALLLLGSYGAGQGAVELHGARLAIHNDLDFVGVVGTERQARALRGACVEAARRASDAAGAAVDLWPIAVDELSRPLGKLLWVDASVKGYRLVHGDPALLRGIECLVPRDVHSEEIGRLVVNRATGVALSRLAFDAGEPEEKRATRHLAKAWVALGDALLLSVDRYHAHPAERSEELHRLSAVGASFVASVADGYERSVALRAQPVVSLTSREEVEGALQPLWEAFRNLESHRLGEPAAPDPWAYAQAASRRFPRMGDVHPVARALGGVKAARHGVMSWRHAWRHPREILARASALLAFEPDLPRACAQAGLLLGIRDASSTSVARGLERLRDVGA
ncbi:MAG: glycosyltransferase [Deltaproteobacteria bacterium]|nr:glycosyltransferase [Deltaproteobacteria bacterium]